MTDIQQQIAAVVEPIRARHEDDVRFSNHLSLREVHADRAALIALLDHLAPVVGAAEWSDKYIENWDSAWHTANEMDYSIYEVADRLASPIDALREYLEKDND